MTAFEKQLDRYLRDHLAKREAARRDVLISYARLQAGFGCINSINRVFKPNFVEYGIAAPSRKEFDLIVKSIAIPFFGQHPISNIPLPSATKTKQKNDHKPRRCQMSSSISRHQHL